MTVTDPVDARLLAALADVGKAAVHEIAAKVGLDPKEVAYRLVGLSASGLPLLVGVESDPNGLRAALSGSNAWASGQAPQPPPAPSGPPPRQPGPAPAHPARGTPSGPYPPPQAPPQPRQPTPPPPQPAQQAPQPRQPVAADPVLSTWGPPQTAGWARSDQGASAATAAPKASGGPRPGRIGDTLESTGLEGETLAIQLLEVQDPADFLFGAAGYQLGENERAVVVHTEITNRGQIPFVSLPDNYLELITSDGRTIAKDPMSLTSRPPHKIGVQPGETAGGHTVYVLPGDTRIVTVRWSPRPEPDNRSRTWTIED